MRKYRSVFSAVFLAVSFFASICFAEPITFNFVYDGASFGNSAMATGSITFAAGFPANPSSYEEYLIGGAEILDMEVTVTGASSGNGAFTMSDFDSVYWDTNGGFLDFSQDLVGQSTDGSAWGSTDCMGGVFDFLGSTFDAPSAYDCFTIGADGGGGDQMVLVSMAKAEPITFNFVYDGSSFGNSAMATGSITFAAGFPANPTATGTYEEYLIGGAEIIDLEVTVTGASSGNGTFTMSDFDSVYWDTNCGFLDFSQDLVGQSTDGSAWGSTDCMGGAFDLMSSTSGAPYGYDCFTIMAGGGSSDQMALVSMTTSSPPIYVDADATGSDDGSSWADAFVSVQDALAVASDGDQIWVAAGTYYPDEGDGQTNNDRLSTFNIPSGVKVYGGFDGTDGAGGGAQETSITQRDWETNVTILSGDLNQNDASSGDNSENAYHVVSFSGVNDNTILDGFTITGGNANVVSHR